MGPILFRWVACEMNLVSLVEVTFSSNASKYVSDMEKVQLTPSIIDGCLLQPLTCKTRYFSP
jgi:hypothetical protein